MRGIINYLSDSIIVLSLFVIVTIPLLVFWYAGKYRMYEKAKEDGWQAIIPIYDYYVLTQMTKTNWWWFLVASLPTGYFLLGGRLFLLHFYLLSLIGKFVIHYNLVKKYRKNDLFALGMTILPLPFYCYLGLSESKVNNRIKITPNGPFDDYTEEVFEEVLEPVVNKPSLEKPKIKKPEIEVSVKENNKVTKTTAKKKAIVELAETSTEVVVEKVKEEVTTEVKKHTKKRATITKKEAIKREKELAKSKKIVTKPVKKTDPKLKKKYARKLEQARIEKEEIKKANIKKNSKKKTLNKKK